jgi:hypothetical protein
VSIAASFGAIEVPWGSSVRICAIRATHSLQIHTTAMAEVSGAPRPESPSEATFHAA